MIPIGDDNVVGGYKPYLSYALILINVLVFLLQIYSPGNLVCDFAAIPNEVFAGKSYFTVVTSTFLHGGWMHLLGNMLFIWIFADNIEATVGSMMFIIFYMLGGLAGSMLHLYFEYSTVEAVVNCCSICPELMECEKPCPGSIPVLGASGAISAVMGAYLVMFPKSRIKIWALIFTFRWPAYLFLLLWFAEQLISGLGALGPSLSGGVAWWAHIGGFVFGLAGGFYFRQRFLSQESEEFV